MHHLETSLFPWTLQLPLSVFLWSCPSQSWNWEMCLLAHNALLGVILMWWTTMAKSNLLGKGLCGIQTLRYVAHHWENPRQQLKPSGNLEAGAEAATMEEQGTTHKGLDPPPSITKKMLYRLSRSYGGIFSTEGPSWMPSSCQVHIKLAKTGLLKKT